MERLLLKIKHISDIAPRLLRNNRNINHKIVEKDTKIHITKQQKMPGLGRKQEINLNRTALQIQKIADNFNTRLIAPVGSHHRNPNQSRNSNNNSGNGSFTMVSRYLSFWKQSPGGSNSTAGTKSPVMRKK